VNFGRRYYVPELGRWLTPDPAGFTDGMNLYAYVHNDPLTHLDEYGLLDYGQWEPKSRQFDQRLSHLPRQLASDAAHSLYDYFLLPFRTDSILARGSPFNPHNDHLVIDTFFGTNITARNDAFRAKGVEFTYGYLPTPGKLLSSGTRVISAIRNQVVIPTANPLMIRFSQPTISQNFSDGRSINDLIQGLRSGWIRVNQIPTIRVVEYERNLVTLDNRRLAAFQNAKINSIPIERVNLRNQAIYEEFKEKFNPINYGKNIVVIPKSIERIPNEEFLRLHGKIK